MFPEDAELRKFHANYIKTSIQKFFDEEMRDDYRNAAAHFKLDEESSLDVSFHYNIANFEEKLILLHLAARVLIDDRIKYFQDLNAVSNGHDVDIF